MRARLIAKYGKAAERPDGMIPAQLLGNMWAQEWGNIYDIVAPTDPKLAQFKPLDLEAALKQQIAEKDPAAAPAFVAGTDLSSDAGHAAQLAAAHDMVHYGENFFKSLGFAPLPQTFWERSQFVHPRDREVVCHASAWDVDSVDDLRVKMCIEVNADYFTTVHHELGHNFYQRAYDKQPFLFRNGANDGFHEAIGDSIALSITPAYLKTLGLADDEPPAEADIPLQLRTALDKVAFLPFALALDKWRWQVFSGQIKPADYNKAWWALREKYQGVAPPVERSEADFDAGAKNARSHQRALCALLSRPHLPVPVLQGDVRRQRLQGPAEPLQLLRLKGCGRQAEQDARGRAIAAMAADAERDDRHGPSGRAGDDRLFCAALCVAEGAKQGESEVEEALEGQRQGVGRRVIGG